MDYSNSAFISYNSADAAFAKELESRLEHYTAPKQLGVEQRRLKVFRFEADMTGTDYYDAIDKHLDQSRCLIVLCSPAARKSTYVDDEVRRFIEKTEGSRLIIPVLIDGVPNNEATSEEEKAFPESLYLNSTMPLAIDYRDYDNARGKIHSRPFEAEWFSLLANLFNVSRDAIEQRDRARRIRKLKITTSIVSLVAVALFALAVIAWVQRGEAVSARYNAEERLVTLAAETADRENQPVRALLLATKALKIAQKAQPGKRSDRAEKLMHKSMRGLPGIGLAGWQVVTPRQTSITPWYASEDSGRWLMTGHFGSNVARLWDLSDANPGRTDILITGVSRAGLSEGRVEFDEDIALPDGQLSTHSWILNGRMFNGRENALPKSTSGNVISASEDWRLVQREDGQLWLEQVEVEGVVNQPAMIYSAPDIEWTQDTDMLFSLNQKNWLLMLGYRGHRLLNLSTPGARVGGREPIVVTRWLSESGRLLIASDGQLIEHDGSVWRELELDLSPSFFRSVVTSSNSDWLILQGGAGNRTIWQRDASGYKLIYNINDNWVREGKFDRLGEQLMAMKGTPLPQIKSLPGYNVPQPMYQPAITISEGGVLSVRSEESILEVKLPEMTILSEREVTASEDSITSSELFVDFGTSKGVSPDGSWVIGNDGLASLHKTRKKDGGWPDIGGGSYATSGLFSENGRWLLLQYGYRGYAECGYFSEAKLIDLAHEDPLLSALNLVPDRSHLNGEGCLGAEFTKGGNWLTFGNLLVSLQEQSASVIDLEGHIAWISPEEDRLLLETLHGESYSLRFQSLNPQDLIDQACEKAGRNLSREEWMAVFPGQPYEAICVDHPVPPNV